MIWILSTPVDLVRADVWYDQALANIRDQKKQAALRVPSADVQFRMTAQQRHAAEALSSTCFWTHRQDCGEPNLPDVMLK